MKSQPIRRTRIAAAVGALLALGGGQALGAGFALQEQSGSGLGNAFAGGAAAAEDASTVYWNPAGMSRMTGVQGAVVASLICLSDKFNNSNSQPAALQPLGDNGGDAGDCNVIPALYLVVPINKQFAFGIAVNTPFGLKTEYNDTWIGRFQANESKVESYNVNPALSWKVAPNFTVGAGVSWQRLKATLTNEVNYAGAIGQAASAAVQEGLIPPTVVPPILAAYAGAQTAANVNGSDNAWGWNIGVLWDVDPQTRLGVHYRSEIKHTVGGTASFDNPPVPSTLPPAIAPVAGLLANGVNAVLANGNVTLDIKLPSTTNVSLFHSADKWDWMADLQYVNWSTIQNLTVVRSTGEVLENIPTNYRNTWRGSIGANYHYSDQWMFRGGIAYDQTPVNNTDREPRLPDNNRTWFAIGAQYKFTPQFWMDLGYSYLYISNPNISQNGGNTAQNGLVDGNYKASVNIAAIQLTYQFK